MGHYYLMDEINTNSRVEALQMIKVLLMMLVVSLLDFGFCLYEFHHFFNALTHFIHHGTVATVTAKARRVLRRVLRLWNMIWLPQVLR